MAVSKDYEAAAEWVEHDMTLPQHSKTAVRGDAAARYGSEVLRRAGRPTLDPTAAVGTHSPRRQVRLPQELSTQVDELAERLGTRPAHVMREAIRDYIARHSTPA